MITIQKGLTNSTIFTLNEKITLTNPNIFIEFYSNQDHDSKLMWLNTDLSLNQVRYNQYDIVETNSEDIDNQMITLDVATYDYRVYQTGGTALSLTASDISIIESGMVKVTGTPSTPSTFEGGQNEYTFE